MNDPSAAAHGPSTMCPTAVRPWMADSIEAPNLHRILDDRPVGECQSQDHRLGVRPGRNLDQRPLKQLVDQPVAVIDHVEASILGHAVRPEEDLVARLEPETADRRDVQAGDGRHGPMLPDHAPVAPGR